MGAKLAYLRKQKGVTQEEMAIAVGVSTQAVSKWEREKNYPDITLLSIIANYFGVTIDYLFQ